MRWIYASEGVTRRQLFERYGKAEDFFVIADLEASALIRTTLLSKRIVLNSRGTRIVKRHMEKPD